MKQIIVKKLLLQSKTFCENIQFYFNRMDSEQRLSLVAIAIAMLQCMVRLGSMGEYGFHQDELLYIALSKHLAWGYSETPPFIAFVGDWSSFLFGDSLVAFRTIPCCCAAAIVYFTGKITIKLGGGTFAVLLACCAVAFSSAFLASGALFIPQVFDELIWTLLAYIIVIWLRKKQDNYLLLAALVLGIGLYIKYTVIIYAIGLLIGILWAEPSVWNRKKFWMAMGLIFLMFIPHLIWQFDNGFPALGHYQELQQAQLKYLSKSELLLQQLAINGTGLIIWVFGIFLLIKNHLNKSNRFILISFFFVMGILFILNGKSYYALGAYPVLFAVGSLYWERKLRQVKVLVKAAFLSALVIPNLLLALVVLPHLPIEKAAKVFEWTYVNLNMHYPLKWEDQKIHNMNQNYADMIGWDELAMKTAKVYHSLSKDEQKKTIVFATKYGEAGAIDYYKNAYSLPDVVSFSSSYSLWAPNKFTYRNIILITDSVTKWNYYGCEIIKKAEITNPYARIKGIDIYLVKDTHLGFKRWYMNNKTMANKAKIDLFGFANKFSGLKWFKE